MKRLKHETSFFFILILLFSFLNLQSETRNVPEGEKLIFHLRYLNMHVATLKFRLQHTENEGDVFRLRVDAIATPTAKKLFPVDNHYLTVFQRANFLPVLVEKKINQKNVQYQRTQNFFHQKNVAVVDSCFNYEIPAPCFDYFSMLYFLRFSGWDSTAQKKIYLDGEFIVSQVRVEFLPDTVSVKIPAGEFSAIKVHLLFKSINKQKRPWKTDLLTNRLTKSGSDVIIFLSADAKRLPLKIVYRNSWVRTKLELVEF